MAHVGVAWCHCCNTQQSAEAAAAPCLLVMYHAIDPLLLGAPTRLLQQLLADNFVCCHACAQICVGFGVSKPEHAHQIKAWGAEGVICGSALVKALGEAKSPVRHVWIYTHVSQCLDVRLFGGLRVM